MEYHAHEVARYDDTGKPSQTKPSSLQCARPLGTMQRITAAAKGDMSAEQLLDFLKSKGKFVEVPGGYTVNTTGGGGCGH